jgi:hypothetical protein
MPSGGGFISVPGVLRPPQPTHADISRRGGLAKSALKREASLRNLERAKAAKAARRAYEIAGQAILPPYLEREKPVAVKCARKH